MTLSPIVFSRTFRPRSLTLSIGKASRRPRRARTRTTCISARSTALPVRLLIPTELLLFVSHLPPFLNRALLAPFLARPRRFIKHRPLFVLYIFFFIFVDYIYCSVYPMLWLEEADHACARRSEEGWEKIGHVVTSTLPSIVCTKKE